MEGFEKVKNPAEILDTNFEFILKLAQSELSEGQSEEETIEAIAEIIKKTMDETNHRFPEFIDRLSFGPEAKFLSESAKKRIEIAYDLYVKENSKHEDLQ